MSCPRLGATSGILRVAALAVILLSCVSCAHLEAVPRTEANAQQLIGQEIRVTTIDRQILEFRLLDVTENALIGESEQVRFDDIALLERRGFNIMKNKCLLMGAGAAGMFLAIGLSLDALNSSSK